MQELRNVRIARQGGDLHDSKGYPIYPGDLVRTPHFRTRRRRYWLYHVVTYNPEHNVLEMVPTSHLDPINLNSGGRCWLHQHMAAQCEILDGHGPEPYLDFRDRPRQPRLELCDEFAP